MDRMTEVMDWLDGLTWEDWSDYHSDSEVRNIAQAALELLKEQQQEIEEAYHKGYVDGYQAKTIEVDEDADL